MATDVITTIGVAGTYPTIDAWESATEGDLVLADERRIGELIDAAHTETVQVNMTGATTNATCYRMLRAAPGNTSSVVTMTVANTYQFWVQEGFFRLGDSGRGFTLKQGNDDAAIRRLLRVQSATMSVESMWFDIASSSASLRSAVFCSTDATFRNLVVIGDGAGDEIGFENASQSSTYQNIACYNLASNGWTGIDVAGCTIENCAAVDSGIADFDTHTAATFNANASSDATGSAGLQNVSKLQAWNNPDGGDFRPFGASSLRATGTDIIGSNPADIDGNPWRGSFNIGPYDGQVRMRDIWGAVDTIGSSGDYTSVESWNVGTAIDLVVADERRIGSLIDPSIIVAANLVLQGATTDNGRFRMLVTAQNNQHDPITGSLGAITGTGTSNTALVEWREHFAHISGPMLITNNASVNPRCIGLGDILTAGAVHYGDMWADAIVVTTPLGGNESAMGIYARPDSATPAVISNVIAVGEGDGVHGPGRGIYSVSDSDCLVVASVGYNIDVTDGGRGFDRDIIAIGCVVIGSGITDFRCSINQCASSDATGTSGFQGLTDVVFEDAAGGNFHPAAGSVLINAVSPLSWDYVRHDFDGELLGEGDGLWNMGAYELTYTPPSAGAIRKIIGPGGLISGPALIGNSGGLVG